MQADDVAPAQQLIELYLLDRHIINPENMMFETEHLAAKGVAQAGNLQPDGTAPDNPKSLAKQFVADQSAIVAGGTDGRVRRDDPPQEGDHQPNGQLAYRMDSVTYILDQLGIAQASCVADEEAMTALFQEISEPRPDRGF